MKKIFLLPVAFLLVNFLYIGCCHCIESLGGKPYRDITGMRIYESGNGLYSRDTVNIKDSLTISINFPYQYIANLPANPMKQFVGTANAFSCSCIPLPDSGYKYKIDSLKIISDKDLFGIAAGQDVGGLFKAEVYSTNSYSSIGNLSISAAVDSINSFNGETLRLQLVQANPAIKTHKFTYSVYVNGRKIDAYSRGKLIWQ